ncbi:MAG: peptidoglycan DD-metalloendopeptidase family protein [Nitrococcus sp.]|nr:peptidoglycan DD-metalloendopeptidase family protein [Nitrococcus sp.]
MAFKSQISCLDFKPKLNKRQPTRSLRWHWIVLGISAFTSLALLLSAKDKAEAMPERNALQQLPQQTPDLVAAIRTLELPIPKLYQTLPMIAPESPADRSAAKATPNSPAVGPSRFSAASKQASEQLEMTLSGTDANWDVVTVEPGDSLATIFKRQGLSSKDVFDVVHANDEVTQVLTRLFPGDKIWLRMNGDGTLLALRRTLDETTTLMIARQGVADAVFHATLTEQPLDRRVAHTSFVIHESLYQAAMKAGLDEKLIMELSGIFAWDIDFAHDLREGDSFALVYRQYYNDGKKIRNGEILAAEFINHGKHYRAVRYMDPSGRTGYYTPQGKSMRKAFLRTPVDFRRISSHFSKSRCHPILHVCRPHEGTDFAAAAGTPIQAAGDGVVELAGRKGGYGNTVILQHGHGYTTLYGHMKRIRKGIHAGVRVTQGQIIGYVGESGLATGPHLHYEFRVAGEPRDVLKVKLPDAEPIDERYLADFKATALPRLAQLAVITRTELARNEER